jgi:aspartate beta-hydroxylase
VLAPQTHIKPHHGVTNTRVVTHLPLVIPAGDCKLVVGGDVHAWRQDRCVTFDDTFLHEAWNRTDHTRVVLILDTWNPWLHAEECVVLKDLVEGIGAFNLRAGIR